MIDFLNYLISIVASTRSNRQSFTHLDFKFKESYNSSLVYIMLKFPSFCPFNSRLVFNKYVITYSTPVLNKKAIKEIQL